jgi:hypothetical protein
VSSFWLLMATEEVEIESTASSVGDKMAAITPTA